MEIFNSMDCSDDMRQMLMDMPDNQSRAIEYITDQYLEHHLYTDAYGNYDPKAIADEILRYTRILFCIKNSGIADKNMKWDIQKKLSPAQIAKVMLRIYHIKNINYIGLKASEEFDILSIYQDCGENEGIYVSSMNELERTIKNFHFDLTERDIKEVLFNLKISAERTEICSDRNLIAVNNGIFDYEKKYLRPFSPDYVFIAKCCVDYNPAATNPVLHCNEDNTDWDVESWVAELFPDGSDIPETIWQIIGAVIRYNVRWDKSCWFVSERGCNGKGTLCRLIRNIVGENSCSSLSLADFKEKFMISELIGKMANICDENSVGTFIDETAKIKAMITGDPITIDRKFRPPVAILFRGLSIQCVNELPRIKDRSPSFIRRLLFIPFTKSYTGKERKYIKEVYLSDKAVLEYCLYRVLNMPDYYKLAEPAACKNALDNYQVFNDPVRDFLTELFENVSWECVPNAILYDMYKGWFAINNPSGSPQGRNTFLNDVRSILASSSYGWYYGHKRVGKRMNGEEPLLDTYNCVAWMQNPHSTNRSARVYPKTIPAVATGIFKCTGSASGSSDGTGSGEEPDAEKQAS